RLDVGRIGSGLYGQAGDGQLDHVALTGGRWSGRNDDPVVGVQPLAAEVIAAFDHRRWKVVKVGAGLVEQLEVVREPGIGVAVLGQVGGVEIAVEFEHHQHGRGKVAVLADHLGGGRDVRLVDRFP